MKPLRPILLCLYRYDALDRLIGLTPSDEAQLQRFYCKSRLTTEVQGVVEHSIVQQGDLLLAQKRVDGDALETSLLATDQQRSVIQTLKADHPSQPLAYSPYGHRSLKNGMLNLLGFNGERPDPVTGHYLLGNGYRAFNPVLMRFNSPDSLSPFGKGGLNSYAYCLGDPINRIDPNGHFAFFTWLKAKWTGKLAYNGGVLSINPNVSTTAAIKARDKLAQLDNKIAWERSVKYGMRSNRMEALAPSGSMTKDGLIKNTILDSIFNPTTKTYSYLDLKTIAIDGLKNRHLRTLQNSIGIANPYNPTLHKMISKHNIAQYLDPHVKKFYKEVKEIRNPYLTEAKQERAIHYQQFFTSE